MEMAAANNRQNYTNRLQMCVCNKNSAEATTTTTEAKTTWD